MNQVAIERTAEFIDGKGSRLKAAVQAYLNEPKILWSYCNSILYRMCEEQPLHDDIDIVAGKLLIIGRTYSAAIERRKTKDGHSSDYFYYSVAEKMTSIHKELDKKISDLRDEPKLTEENIDKMILAHKFLSDFFCEFITQSDRSFVSKYLHFHCPHMFYIFDSRAETSITKLIKKNNSRLESHTHDGDKTYTDFALRCLEIQERTEQEYQRLLSPRDIDNILLGLTD